ncbi:MAG TPA: hypothetical protein VGD55_04765 [Acidothermaceae bacterium]
MAHKINRNRARHITRRIIVMATTGTATAAFGVFGLTPAAHAATHDSAVFVQTNDADGNTVIAYDRANDGSLHVAGHYATGGLGGSEAGAVVDPLASQGSLTYDANHQLLLVVNAGSDTLTVFAVDGSHLHRVQILGSKGHLPTSIGVSGNLAYVLDAGNDGAITGFKISGGRLHTIDNSTRSLSLGNPADPNFLSAPSQVAISPDLRDVVVGTKTHGVLDVFTLNHSGVPSTSPAVTTSAGAVPFAVGFDPAGRLLVAEASGGASSYSVQPDGSLTTISSHIANGQAATCWGASAKGFIYVANAGSNSITAYVENSHGELSLLNGSEVAAVTDGGPVDMATSSDGR